MRPDKPNILLVHGAWGDASHWRHVIPPLHEKGYRVFAVQNPLTSLSDDIDRTIKMAAAQDAGNTEAENQFPRERRCGRQRESPIECPVQIERSFQD